MYTQENSNHLRLHLRAIMALDHSRLDLENKFFWNKSSRIFCVRQVYLIKSCLKIWWLVTSLFHFLYITSEVKQYTMRRCFYHTGIGQKGLFHNFARQIALYATCSIQEDRSAREPFKFLKSPSIQSAGSHFWQAPNL